MTVSSHPIVGTWSLQSFTERDIKTNALSYPMGERPKATVIYIAGGHVATIFTATGRRAPAGLRATDAEACIAEENVRLGLHTLLSYSRIAVSPGCALARLSRKISGNATSATSIISLKSLA
jgi:Lipocalin-like domain